jgi:hypothetical protein
MNLLVDTMHIPSSIKICGLYLSVWYYVVVPFFFLNILADKLIT